MKKGDGIKITAFNYWMGVDALPAETSELIESCKVGFGYFLTWDVLETLIEKYDVQIFHKTVLLGNHRIPSLILMLDSAGGRHRQR